MFKKLVGREDVHAQAILFYNSSDLGVKHIGAEMKNYCQFKKCLREVINEFLGSPQKLNLQAVAISAKVNLV